eukprot:SAG11_NODE_2207_length_3686_cov_7.684137_4_plen_55_part_00
MRMDNSWVYSYAQKQVYRSEEMSGGGGKYRRRYEIRQALGMSPMIQKVDVMIGW